MPKVLGLRRLLRVLPFREAEGVFEMRGLNPVVSKKKGGWPWLFWIKGPETKGAFPQGNLQ